MHFPRIQFICKGSFSSTMPYSYLRILFPGWAHDNQTHLANMRAHNNQNNQNNQIWEHTTIKLTWQANRQQGQVQEPPVAALQGETLQGREAFFKNLILLLENDGCLSGGGKRNRECLQRRQLSQPSQVRRAFPSRNISPREQRRWIVDPVYFMCTRSLFMHQD